MVILVGAAIGITTLVLPPPWGESIVTAADEWETLSLSDGTIVRASPNTRMNVRYSSGHRRIYLKHGAAEYEVAYAPSRPFDVVTGAGEVRAVGTTFSVNYRPPDGARITVLEGVVKITNTRPNPDAGEAGREYQLVAGNSASLSGGKVTVAPSRVYWDGETIRIEGATIGEVAAQLSRRGPSRIVVDDPNVATIVIPDMAFNRNESQQFVERIKSSPNIAVHETDGVVHLKSRAGPCASWLICGDSQ